MVNAVFIVTIPNLDGLVNYPFYYKIICSSPFHVQRATTWMEYFILFLHEIVWIRSGDNKVTKFRLALEWSPWYQISYMWGLTFVWSPWYQISYMWGLTFVWSPWYQISYMWGLTFYLYVDNTCLTAPFHRVHMLGVIGTDYIGSYKFVYYAITATTSHVKQ